MSAQEMTPERLAEIRTMSADPDSGDNWCDRLDLLGDVAELLEHLDAITADRDEARSEVAALAEKLRALVQAIDVAMANGYETSHATRDAIDDARGAL